MNYKVVMEPSMSVQVLVRRDVDDHGEAIVVLESYVNADSEEAVLYEEIKFPNAFAAQDYVRDFSPESATGFVCRRIEMDGLTLDGDENENEEPEGN